VHSVKGLPARF